MKYVIAVAGAHGKTTTTSMTAQVLEAGGYDPTIIVGGRLNTIGSNAKLGEGDFIVAEADESDRSFLYLSPFIAVLTNIDEEHLDQYGTLNEIKKTFVYFANKVPFYCPVILCLDDPNLQSIMPQIERKIITYGFSPEADIQARDFEFDGFSSYSTLYVHSKKAGRLKLNVPGPHNILNALAATAVGLDLDIEMRAILQALEDYTGTGRRFELKKVVNDIMIIEDYAHHPTEIKATLQAARTGWKRRLVVAFQPHRFSRLARLQSEFATAFRQADLLFLTEIYPAGEKPIPGVSGQSLFEAIQRAGQTNVRFEPELDRLPALLADKLRSGDMLLVLGAGHINRIIPEVIKILEKEKTNGS